MDMPQVLGNTVMNFEGGGKGTLAEIQARVDAAERAGLNNLPPADVTPPQPTTQNVEAAPPAVPDAEPKVNIDGILQQPKDKESKLDEGKILKSNEHLEKAIVSRTERAALLQKQNKELREKFRQATEEVKRLESERPSPFDGMDPDHMPDEFKKQLELDADKDFFGTNAKFVTAIIRREMHRDVTPLKNQINEIHQKTRDTSEANELDELIEQGHTWIADEGLARFEREFKARPYLLQSQTPYKDALRFIDDVPLARNSAPGSAQPVVRSPILGANRAVPSPSPMPPVTIESSMEQLSHQIQEALSNKDYRVAKQLQDKADELYRRMSR